MIKILFVCHGNICRSPMAEFVFNKMAEDAGFSGEARASSAAVSNEESGNTIYPPAAKTLRRHGIPYTDRYARRVSPSDYDEYDMIVIMEEYNRRGLMRIIGDDPEGKVSLMMDHTDTPGDVADPWYTRDFERAYSDIERGCEGLLRDLGFL